MRDIPRGAYFYMDIATLDLLRPTRRLGLPADFPTSLFKFFDAEKATYEFTILIAADNAKPQRDIKVTFKYDPTSNDLELFRSTQHAYRGGTACGRLVPAVAGERTADRGPPQYLTAAIYGYGAARVKRPSLPRALSLDPAARQRPGAPASATGRITRPDPESRRSTAEAWR